MPHKHSLTTRLHTWHQTPSGLAVFGVGELILMYIVASLAIDRGSLWYYALGIVLLIGGVHNLARLVRRIARKAS